MKTCPKCHKEFEDLYTFCIKDGTPLENVVAETDSDIEQVTVLQPHPEPPPIPPPVGEETAIMDSSDIAPIGEETAIMDSSDIAPIGEETAIMSDADFQQVGNIDDYEAVEDFEAKYGKTKDLGQTVIENESGETVIPDQDWDEENVQDESQYAATQIPIAQEELAATPQQPVREAKSRSKVGLILAGVGLLGLFLLGTAAIGVYLYMQSGNSPTEIGSANAEDTANTDTDTNSDENLESDLSNVNADENIENSNLGEDSATDSIDNRQVKKEKDKDKVADDKKKTPTPTATPKNKATDDTTPTPNATPNFDIRVSTPRPTRTPTPRPTRTPTPRPTQQNVPSRIAGGVVNGKAISLPKPVYTSAARAANAKGSVNVVVVISKTGRVISANAVSGHPLLRQAAVSAARRARFNPTRLSGQAVEVSGTIVYNFQ